MSISTEIHCRLFLVFAGFLIFATACTRDLVIYESYDPLFQMQTLDSEEAKLIAQPITSRLAGQHRHLTPYVGHLILGNQLVHVVIAGVPPLPYQTEEHPLILKLFQKSQDKWLELSEIPELRLALRDQQGRFLQPVALNSQLDQQQAKLELRYGEANSWQQEPLVASLTLKPQDNRIQIAWHYQPSKASPAPIAGKEEARYQLRLRSSKTFQQAISFQNEPAKIHILRQGLETLALVQRGDWQWQNQGGSTIFLSTTDQSQDQALGFHVVIGRFGLMEVAARYLAHPPCALSHSERPCVRDELDHPLQLVQIRLAAKTHPLPYYSLMPLVYLSLPGLEEPLQLPLHYGESLELLLPRGSKIELNRRPDDTSAQLKSDLETHQAKPGSPPQIITLADNREFVEFPLQNLLVASQAAELQVSMRPAATEHNMVYFSGQQGQAMERHMVGPVALIPLKTEQSGFRLETGHYKLSLFHAYGPICHQDFHADRRAASNTQICQDTKPWHEAVKNLQALAKAWAPKSPSSSHGLAHENPLELVHDAQQSDKAQVVYWFHDPNFSVNLRIEQPQGQSDLVAGWQNFRQINRSPSIFQFKQFLTEHAPAAKLALGCPSQTMSIHDYESLAKALGGLAFEIFGCHDLNYEDQLFQAIDRLQGGREYPLTIQPSTLYLASLANRLAYPSWNHEPAPDKTSRRMTVGAGAAVQIVGSDGPALMDEKATAVLHAKSNQKLTLTVRADVFSSKFIDLSLRIIALRKDGTFLTVAEQSLPSAAGRVNSPSRDISLEIPPGTSYLRAEILAETLTGGAEQRLRLATSQYWPIAKGTAPAISP